MPPAPMTRFAPALIKRMPVATASKPDAHTLFNVSAVTVFARPDLKSTWRAGFCPTPAWSTSPKMTCSISLGSSPERCNAATKAAAPSVVASSEASTPPSLPNGVRAKERTTVCDSIRPITRLGFGKGALDTFLFRRLRQVGTADDDAAGIAVLALELNCYVADRIALAQHRAQSLEYPRTLEQLPVLEQQMRG